MFSKAWPKMSGPYADKLNSIPKLVASTTLSEPLIWNAHLVKGDVAQELKKIKAQGGRDILMYGSPVLMRSLLQHGLIDQFPRSFPTAVHSQHNVTSPRTERCESSGPCRLSAAVRMFPPQILSDSG
jgi:dihydrofolate reductase